MALLRLSDVNLTCLPALLPACLRPQTNDVPRQCRSSLQRDDAARGGGDDRRIRWRTSPAVRRRAASRERREGAVAATADAAAAAAMAAAAKAPVGKLPSCRGRSCGSHMCMILCSICAVLCGRASGGREEREEPDARSRLVYGPACRCAAH